MEAVVCRDSELNYLSRGSENLQGWYRTGKKSGRRRRAEVEGSRSIAAFESPELTGDISTPERTNLAQASVTGEPLRQILQLFCLPGSEMGTQHITLHGWEGGVKLCLETCS